METPSETLTLTRPRLRRIPELRHLVRWWVRALTAYVLLRGLSVPVGRELAAAMGDPNRSPWALTWPAVTVLVGIVGFVVWVFGRRQREFELFANLGVGTRLILGLTVMPVVAVELLARWVLA